MARQKVNACPKCGLRVGNYMMGMAAHRGSGICVAIAGTKARTAEGLLVVNGLFENLLLKIALPFVKAPNVILQDAGSSYRGSAIEMRLWVQPHVAALLKPTVGTCTETFGPSLTYKQRRLYLRALDDSAYSIFMLCGAEEMFKYLARKTGWREA